MTPEQEEAIYRSLGDLTAALSVLKKRIRDVYSGHHYLTPVQKLAFDLREQCLDIDDAINEMTKRMDKYNYEKE